VCPPRHDLESSSPLCGVLRQCRPITIVWIRPSTMAGGPIDRFASYLPGRPSRTPCTADSPSATDDHPPRWHRTPLASRHSNRSTVGEASESERDFSAAPAPPVIVLSCRPLVDSAPASRGHAAYRHGRRREAHPGRPMGVDRSGECQSRSTDPRRNRLDRLQSMRPGG
jgi:hypothetical protein